MHAKHFLLLALLSTTCTAFAQWQWVDDNGHKVFSDRPPPAHIAPANILKRPNSAPALSSATPPTATAAASQSAAGMPAVGGKPAAGVDPALAEKKAAQEAAEASQKKAEEARVAQARKDNCARAQQARAALSSGQLMTTTNSKGERMFMDEATRKSETTRAESTIATDC